MITLTTLKQYLNITDNSKDDLLQSCINASVAEIEDYCHRKLSSASYTDYINGNDKSEIYLRNYPITAVTSVSYFDGYDTYDNLFIGSDTPANSIIIIAQTNSLKLIKGYYFYNGCKNFKIIYTAGYTTETAPEDLKSVLLELASLKYFNSPLSGQARLGKSSDNVNSATGESTSFKDPDWKKVLDKYRLQNI